MGNKANSDPSKDMGIQGMDPSVANNLSIKLFQIMRIFHKLNN